MAAGANDGRARQRHKAADWGEPIDYWLSLRDPDDPLNLADLYDWLAGRRPYMSWFILISSRTESATFRGLPTWRPGSR